ncbi:hypothetical protein ACIRD6_26130 [Streptomyces sp. NPDC102473]|uniref:hypothetical protein n=1 Tax=Streptomyces sp. NPDC102473 TaxID=3366180 RepID=UPI00380E959F
MRWRDRLRRRAVATSAAAPAQGAPGTPGPAAPGAPASSVPVDWDGGWRRTAAPELTVSRAPLGVSDGLAFRAGLAAWQNPSFGSGLGHALLPAAPAGVVRGVARPAAPRAGHTTGGPLLLRALRPDGAEDAATADGAPEVAPRPVAGERKPGATGSGQGASAVRPTGAGDDARAGRTGRSVAGPRSRGLTAADSPAVLAASPAAARRAVEPGASPVVAPAGTGRPPVAARTPLVRRVAVVPPAAEVRPPSAPDPGRASAARSASGRRTPSDPAARRAVTEVLGPHPEPSRTPGADGPRTAVRPSPGPRLTVARRPAGPVRRVGAVRPATPPAPTRDASATPAGTSGDPSGATATPVGTSTDSSGTTAQAGTSADSSAPVRRTATPSRGRGPLGAPLSELPSTAVPLARDAVERGAGPAPGPALPVVQRQAGTPVPYDGGTSATGGAASAAPADAPRRTPAPDGPGARARGGLGAPLPELPPSAAPPGSAASPAARASRASATGTGPDVQRAPGANAPLLGTVDARRSLAEHSTTGGTASTGATPVTHGNGPGTPLVTTSPAVAPERPDPANAVAPAGAAAAGRPSGGVSAGGSGSGGSRPDGPTAGSHRADGPRSGGRRPGRPGVPGPVVVARAVSPGTAGIRSAGSADPRPLTSTGSVAHSATAAPRTLSLLAARPLTLSSRLPDGAAPPVVARSGVRPVVAARWPGAPASAQGDTAPPTGAPAHRAGRSPVSPAPPPGGSGTPVRPLFGRPAPPVTPQVQRAATTHVEPEGTRGTRSAPGRDAGAEPSGTPAPVQRVPVVRPAPLRPVTAGAAVAVPRKPLPVTAHQAPPLADRPPGVPAPVGSLQASVGSLPGSLPAVRPRTVVAPGANNPVQRDVAADLPKGVQVKEAPARGRPRSSSAPPAPTPTSTSGKAAARRRPESPQDDPGLDLDDLARRLIDPVSRLLRTELRRGRERTGRPHDGRR